MKKINIPKDVCIELEELAETKKIFLEGNILKIIESTEYEEFSNYIEAAKKNDAENRIKRLDITKTVQEQNKELIKSKEENDKLMEDLKVALQDAEKSKEVVEKRNAELIESKNDNDKLMEDLKEALTVAEKAKSEAEDDLDIYQKKTQFELIGNIVNYALYVIVGTGVITTLLYVMAIYFSSKETTLIGNTWSNLFGILLTNSFSIIGTIMGVKYASGDGDKKQ